MKQLTLLILLFGTFSSGAQTIAPRNEVKRLRIETNYECQMAPQMINRLDSAINSTVSRYNDEKRGYMAVLDTGSADAVLQIKFTKARLITHRQRKAAYWYDALTTTMGLIYMVSGWGTPVAISILPNHRVNSKLTLIINEPGTMAKQKKLHVHTEVLFANSDKQAVKLLNKFSSKLYTELVAINAPVSLSLTTTAK